MLLNGIKIPPRLAGTLISYRAGLSRALYLLAIMLVSSGLKLGTAQAQSGNASTQLPVLNEAVAAIVNDNVISTFDLRQRIRLIALTSGGQIPESAYAQLQDRVLRELVEEKLKLQEAGRLEFEIDPTEIDAELESLATRNRLNLTQLRDSLRSQGIAIETLREQIESNIVWQRLVRARYGRRVNVTENEISTVMNRLREESRKQQYMVSELCLPIENDTNVDNIIKVGMQIIAEMRRGVPFEALARQFSACTSAASGGDLGWVRSGELDPTLERMIEKLKVGSVSLPTYHDGLVRIMAVRQKRDAAVAGEETYILGYAGVPLSYGEAAANDTFAKLPLSNVCNHRERSLDMGQNVSISKLPPLKETDVQDVFRAPLRALLKDTVTPAIRAEQGFHAIMLCEKDEGLGLPSRAAIENKLFQDELSLLARQYLRDVERNSSVEIIFSKNAKATEDK